MAHWAMIFAVAVNLALLFFFKYYGCFLELVNSVTSVELTYRELALPVGISFYTFQGISYVVDVYRGKAKAQRSLLNFALYIALFPQLIAGPIVRYEDIEPQLAQRKVSARKLGQGAMLFLIGLAKKAVLADTFKTVFEEISAISASNLSVPMAWIGCITYAFEIYYDFSGYSDMAIGLSRMFGFELKKNFDHPYVSRSVTEFWRRWHISLSSFFRDYVYIPLGGSRGGDLLTVRNMLIVWALTGIWHGASWNYILWGLYFFVFLVLERFVLKKVLERLPRAVGWIYAMLVVYFGWVLFKFENMAELGNVLAGMFGFGHMAGNLSTLYTLLNNIFLLIISIIAVFPIGKNLRMAAYRYENKRKKVPTLLYYLDAVTPVILILLSLLALVGDSYNPFLYFQF